MKKSTTVFTPAWILYPNDTDSVRIIKADDYNFRYSKLMIFNKDGLLIEAGGDLVANTDGTYGSCQTYVNIPAGGFMIAFSSGTAGVRDFFNAAMEGAMLYNATMSTILPIYGSYDKAAKTLTLRYNDPEKPSVTSGVRIGTPAVTTRGLGREEMKIIAKCIAMTARDFEGTSQQVKAIVKELCEKFPLYK